MLDEKESEILWEKRPTNTMPIKFAGLTMEESIPRNQELEAWSTQHYSRIPPPRSKTCLEEKGEEELTSNHGASQEPGGIDETCSSAHGEEGERTVQTGPSPRKASKSQKASKKEAPLEVEPTSIAIGQ